jgi:hypothetical protein
MKKRVGGKNHQYDKSRSQIRRNALRNEVNKVREGWSENKVEKKNPTEMREVIGLKK